jgi:quercetin dioxygenase-like cupin family protein
MAGREPVLLASGEGGRFDVPGPYTVKLAGEQTAGTLAVLESTFQAGEGAPLHRHQGHDETFYVVSGRFQFRCGEETFEEGPGGFVHVPRTYPHSFTSIGGPSTVLVMLSPAGFEKFFIEAAGLSASGRPDPAAMRTVLQKYDQELVL